MKTLGIVMATRWEAYLVLKEFRFRRLKHNLFQATIANQPVLLALSGVGKEAARRTAHRLCDEGAGVLISAGFCGALVPGLRVGDLVTDRMATVNAPVRNRAERVALARQVNAVACDMETQSVIEAGTRRGVPIHILRVVSDELDDDLSPLLGAGGAYSNLRIALRLVNPKAWPLARRLLRNSVVAKKRLVEALVSFLKSKTS
ncbi:MAG: hypothetical protein WC859_07875 [Elusimicrobiota bacterium]|jgi:nucleoside phosphorylase